jgi:hypothetical protein
MSTPVKRRVLNAVVVLVLAVGVLGWVEAVNASRPKCGQVNSTPTSLAVVSTTSNAPFTTLPPSHDNDAGWARSPDATPDADTDARLRPTYCLSPGQRPAAN